MRFYRDASRSQTPVSTPQHQIAPAIQQPDKKSFFFTDKTKFGNFFSTNSHPDLAFTTTTTTTTTGSQCQKPKQLRAEAKEMVRSLQASRYQIFLSYFCVSGRYQIFLSYFCVSSRYQIFFSYFGVRSLVTKSRAGAQLNILRKGWVIWN